MLWTSPWTVWVAFRYLRSKKSSSFLSFITVLSFMGIGIGVTAMLVVMSVMDGFEDELKKRLMGGDVHVMISTNTETPGVEHGMVDRLKFQPALEVIRKIPEVMEATEILSVDAIMKYSISVKGIELKGVSDQHLEGLKPKLVEEVSTEILHKNEHGKLVRLPGVFIGQELAIEMGLIPGDEITMISPTETQGPLEAVPRMKKMVIEGIYRTGLPEQELSVVYTKIHSVESFIRKRNVATQWELSVSDFSHSPAVADAIRPIVPGFVVRDWRQLNGNLFASLRLERIAMFVILAFIVVVASFNIISTLTMMIMEKRKEIAILKAMGSKHSHVAAIFLAEGLLIGGVGVVGGVITAAGIGLALRTYEFIELPDVYVDRTVPVTFDALYYSGVSISALIIVLCACLYPTFQASRVQILDGLRTD